LLRSDGPGGLPGCGAASARGLAPLDRCPARRAVAWFVATAATVRSLLAVRPDSKRGEVWWFGSVQDSDLRPSDYQKPPPDSAGYGGTLGLTAQTFLAGLDCAGHWRLFRVEKGETTMVVMAASARCLHGKSGNLRHLAAAIGFGVARLNSGIQQALRLRRARHSGIHLWMTSFI
jgi:hypothetical protein